MIEERQRMMAEYGEDWSEKPVSIDLPIRSPAQELTRSVQNDMLQWIMEVAATRDSSVKAIVKRILMINFAAIHTSSAVRLRLPLSCALEKC